MRFARIFRFDIAICSQQCTRVRGAVDSSSVLAGAAAISALTLVDDNEIRSLGPKP